MADTTRHPGRALENRLKTSGIRRAGRVEDGKQGFGSIPGKQPAGAYRSLAQECGKCGGQGRNRTTDTRIFNPLLYRLSYLASLRAGPRAKTRPREARIKPATGHPVKGRAHHRGYAVPMKHQSRVWTLLLLLTLGAPPATSETPDVVEQAMERLAGWGLTGAIMHGEGSRTRASRGFGMADREGGIPFTPDTHIPWHSVSKSVTAAAVLKLSQENELGLSDRLDAHFPDLPPDKARITIEQLLSHSSGLAAQLAHPDFDGPPEFEPIDRETLERRVWASEPLASPDTRFVYSNLGYNLAAAAVERAAGQDFRTFVETQLFAPAGLRHSRVGSPLSDRPEAVGYLGGKRWGRFSQRAWQEANPGWNLMGAGAVIGPITDMAQWLQTLDRDQPLTAENRARWRAPRVDQGDGSSYALGWTVRDSEAGQRIGHEGGFGPFSTKAAWWPESDQWLTVASSSERFHALDLSRLFESLLHGDTHALPPAPGKASLPAPLATLEERPVRFSAGPGGHWDVRRRGDSLLVTAEGPDAIAPLAWPDGRPDELSGIEDELVERMRGLAMGDGPRPAPRDSEEHRTMSVAAEWLEARFDLPLNRLRHLGTTPAEEDDGLAGWFELGSGSERQRVVVKMNRDGHWRGLAPDPDGPIAQAILRGAGNDRLHGMHASRFHATADIEVEDDDDNPTLVSHDLSLGRAPDQAGTESGSDF